LWGRELSTYALFAGKAKEDGGEKKKKDCAGGMGKKRCALEIRRCTIGAGESADYRGKAKENGAVQASKGKAENELFTRLFRK